MKYSPLNTNRKYQELRIENMLNEDLDSKRAGGFKICNCCKEKKIKIFARKNWKKLDYQERRFREVFDHFKKY